MNSILKFVAALLLVAASNAHADGPYYFVDCAAGADPACATHIGSDSNDGLSPATPLRSYTKLAALAGTSPPDGRTIRLANGAKWSASTSIWLACMTCTASNRMIIEGYQPSWGTGTKWEIEYTADVNAFRFEDSSTSEEDKGYIVRGGIIHGPFGPSNVSATAAQFGINFYNDVDDVLIENMEIYGFGGAINMAGGHAPPVTAGDPGDGLSSRIIIRKNYLHDNKKQGILGGCSQCLVEDNDIHDNGWGGNADALQFLHNIYISCGAREPDMCRGMRVVGNRLSRSAVCTALTPNGAIDVAGGFPNGRSCANLGILNKCAGVALVVHSRHQNLVIENNVIDETAGASAGCYGIQVATGYTTESEWFRETVIRGNKVINVGGNGISAGSCPYCIIEGNEVIWTANDGATKHGIAIPDGIIQNGPTYFDDHDMSALIRNNTIFIAGSYSDNIGITVTTPGTALAQRVVNNLVVFGAGTASSASCYNTNNALSNFIAWDYNQCHSSGATPRLNKTAQPLMSDWTGAGFDTHGSFGIDPKIDTPTMGNGYSVKPNNAASPIRNAGHPVFTKKLGIRGQVNPDTTFAGANPYNALIVAPSSPRAN